MDKKTLFSHKPLERIAEANSVVVIGLGRFGGALALELAAAKTDVLGIDIDEEVVQAFDGRLTHVVRADATKEEVLRQLSVHEFDRAVVGIGSDIEASILTTSSLLRFNKPAIWAKAVSPAHGQILEQLGVEHVIRPEEDMGRRVAHLVRGAMLDYVEFGGGLAMVKTRPPKEMLDRVLGEAGTRAKHQVTVIAVKREKGTWDYATADTIVRQGDELIVAGTTSATERFSALL